MHRLNRQALEVDLEGAPPSSRDRVRLFRLLVALGGGLKTRMDRVFESAGVTTQQAHLLTLAGSARKPLSQGEIARLMGVSHQNVKQIALALERKGHLEFRPDEHDARVRRLVPTASARRLFRKRNARDFDVVASWFDGLSDAQVRSLVKGLVGVVQALDRNRLS